MPKNLANRMLTISNQIYRALLLLYPEAHRREYGPLMAQVFRDMCRDAYQVSGVWGLLQLWLRTLFDIATTTIAEHLESQGESIMTTGKVDYEIDSMWDAELIAAELEFFHHQNGGIRLLPELRRADTQTTLIEFFVIDDGSKALISLRPTRHGGTKVSINLNESELWGWQLGISGRSELGVNTYLGSEMSPQCKAFCDSFIKHLEEIGYIGKADS